MSSDEGIWVGFICGLIIGFVIGCILIFHITKDGVVESCQKSQAFISDHQKYECRATGEWVPG